MLQNKYIFQINFFSNLNVNFKANIILQEVFKNIKIFILKFKIILDLQNYYNYKH